jgi:hypothetical protein
MTNIGRRYTKRSWGWRLAFTTAGIGAVGLASLGVQGSALAGAASGSRGSDGNFVATRILSGTSLHHSFQPAGTTTRQTESLTDPDDISQLGGDLFVGFQNGVGPQGQASTDGNRDSTIVEMTLRGDPVAQWDVVGKTDGVTADPHTGTVIATVNEDANSSLYVVDPRSSAAPQHYAYNAALPHGGGTDAISVVGGQLFVSASAPGTTGQPAPQPAYPAVYSVALNPSTLVATATPVFFDEATATVANVNRPTPGETTKLALTDPDSNEVVPEHAVRFGGDFMLTSQGDQKQIYLQNDGHGTRLSVLALSQSVDDTAWPTDPDGELYATDSTDDSVNVVTGPFNQGQPVVVATPCGSNSAPATCPAPPAFPPNYLASLDPWTGQVSALSVKASSSFTPQGGLAFVPGRRTHS